MLSVLAFLPLYAESSDFDFSLEDNIASQSDIDHEYREDGYIWEGDTEDQYVERCMENGNSRADCVYLFEVESMD